MRPSSSPPRRCLPVWPGRARPGATAILAIAVLAASGSHAARAAPPGATGHERTAQVASRAASQTPALRDLADQRGLTIGSAVAYQPLTDPADPQYATVLGQQYSAGTPENEMKWAAIHPAPSTYDFTQSDAIVSYLEGHGMKVRGHNLAWWVNNPAWLEDGSWTPDQLLQVLRDHIATVAGHYRGRVAEWDVVNEAVGFDNGWMPSIWQRVIGPTYIDEAFRAARAADPGAKLIYNDFLLEAPGPRFDAVVNLVAGMKARGAPIDGVGFQAHLGARTCGADCANALLVNMLRLQQLGLDVSITELDVAVPLPADPAKLDQEASVYATALEACLLAPNCHTFMSWGFTDRHSWIPSMRPGYGAALPFDESYTPKPAYDALAAVLARPPVAPSCASYPTQQSAQAAFDSAILGAPLMDPDGDGIACEDLPQAPTTSPTTTEAATPVTGSPAFTG